MAALIFNFFKLSIFALLLSSGIGRTAFSQESEVIPPLDVVEFELTKLKLNYDQLAKESPKVDIVIRFQFQSEIDKRFEKIQSFDRRIGKVRDWPKFYKEEAAPFFAELEAYLHDAFPAESLVDYRRRRVALALRGREIDSGIQFDSPLFLNELEIEPLQQQLIRRKLKRFELQLEKVRREEEGVRNEYLNDCMREFSEEQVRTLLKLTSLTNPKELLTKYPRAQVSAMTEGRNVSEFRMMRWIMLAQIVTFKRNSPFESYGIQLDSDARKEIRRLNDEMVAWMWSLEQRKLIKASEIEKKVRVRFHKIFTEEQLQKVWRKMFPSAVRTAEFPGFAFYKPLVVDVLGLTEKNVSRLNAYQFDASEKIKKLRQKARRIQVTSLKKVVEGLNREQVKKFEYWAGKDYDALLSLRISGIHAN